MNEQLTVGSLFAGIGGFDLGFERAGMRTIWQAEIDEWCQRVLAKHWPEVKRYGDVRTITAESVIAPDVVCAGFPCQPVSIAGKKLAQDDPRWLWPEVARIIGELRPRYAVLENVPGLLDRGMADVLGDLSALGYDAEWGVVAASDAGAPHRRERVWVIASPATDASGAGLEGRQQSAPAWPTQRILADSRGLAGRRWPDQPELHRVGYGLPDWVDRVRALGNALVPQIAQWIGEQIVSRENELRAAA